MEVTPGTRVRLIQDCPINKTYRDTLYFGALGLQAQEDYFMGLTATVHNLMTYQRKERKMQVEAIADNLLNVNYMMFQNPVYYGDRWFYCFVTNVEYVNDACSLVSFEIDVMQTFLYDMIIPMCFVEREHTDNDTIGSNLVPENLDFGEYVYQDWGVPAWMNQWNIVIVATFTITGSKPVLAQGDMYGGIYSGLKMNVFETAEAANTFLSIATAENVSDGIVSVFMLPKEMCYQPGTAGPSHKFNTVQKPYGAIDGYIPRNNKLYTSPYSTLLVTNGEGDGANYPFEYFSSSDCMFEINGAMCATPDLNCVPIHYKGITSNFNEKLTMTNFPQCAYAIDTYRAFIAQNAMRLNMSDTKGLAKTVTGGVMALMIPGAQASGAGTFFSGINDLTNVMALRQDMSTLPPQARGTSSPIADIITEQKGFHFYHAHIRREYLERLDGYFDMAGYKTNRVKTPNYWSRETWNYVKTRGCIVKGGLPSSAMEKIAQIFDNGITFWHDPDAVGDYTRQNGVTTRNV